jgi:hypothetical protein
MYTTIFKFYHLWLKIDHVVIIFYWKFTLGVPGLRIFGGGGGVGIGKVCNS